MPAKVASMALYNDIQWPPRPAQLRERTDGLVSNGKQPGSTQASFEKFRDHRSDEWGRRTQTTIPEFGRKLIVIWLLAATLIVALLAFPTPDKPNVNYAAKPSAASTSHPGITPSRAADDSETHPCSDLDYAYALC